MEAVLVFVPTANRSPVSIHAPRTGCDLRACSYVELEDVSIHAPRTGCDQICYKSLYLGERFNSRTPHGVRLLIDLVYISLPRVSIHAPRTGCDRVT